jgi:hypothetical protein
MQKKVQQGAFIHVRMEEENISRDKYCYRLLQSGVIKPCIEQGSTQ